MRSTWLIDLKREVVSIQVYGYVHVYVSYCSAGNVVLCGDLNKWKMLWRVIVTRIRQPKTIQAGSVSMRSNFVNQYQRAAL